MHALIALIIPVMIVIVVALVVVWLVERFSPDPLITKITYLIVFACVVAFVVTHIMPLLLGG
jgi:hypothetical protein